MTSALLKGKTDAECRQLAGHYYARAQKAERALKKARDRIAELEIQARQYWDDINRMRDLAEQILHP